MLPCIHSKFLVHPVNKLQPHLCNEMLHMLTWHNCTSNLTVHTKQHQKTHHPGIKLSLKSPAQEHLLLIQAGNDTAQLVCSITPPQMYELEACGLGRAPGVLLSQAMSQSPNCVRKSNSSTIAVSVPALKEHIPHPAIILLTLNCSPQSLMGDNFAAEAVYGTRRCKLHQWLCSML
jgi:hypothetical protein